MSEAERILNILSGLRVPPQPEEYEIHSMISDCLQRHGIAFVHESRLSAGRRIDFLSGKVGIEVKKGRPDSKRLEMQLRRYLETDALEAMIVVMQRPCRLPQSICEKPVYILSLNRLWGVALP